MCEHPVQFSGAMASQSDATNIVKTGAEDFDRRVQARGAPCDVHSLADWGARARIRTAVVSGAQVVIDPRGLWVSTPVSVFIGGSLTNTLQHASDMARFLSDRPRSVEQRIEEHVRNDPDAGVRLTNLRALMTHFREAPLTDDAARYLLRDPSPKVLFEAARFLGDEAEDFLVGLLRAPKIDRETLAEVWTYARETMTGESHLKLYRAALDSPHNAVRQSAMRHIGDQQMTALVPRLIDQIGHSNPSECVQIAHALSKFADPSVEDALIVLVEKDYPPLRVTAARALAQVGSSRAIGPLRRAAKGLDGTVNRECSAAIAAILSRGQVSGGELSLLDETGQAGELTLTAPDGGLTIASGEPAGPDWDGPAPVSDGDRPGPHTAHVTTPIQMSSQHSPRDALPVLATSLGPGPGDMVRAPGKAMGFLRFSTRVVGHVAGKLSFAAALTVGAVIALVLVLAFLGFLLVLI